VGQKEVVIDSDGVVCFNNVYMYERRSAEGVCIVGIWMGEGEVFQEL
jgi:hypothetical protein